jgi:hypothetical protein
MTFSEAPLTHDQLFGLVMMLFFAGLFLGGFQYSRVQRRARRYQRVNPKPVIWRP